MVLIGLAVVIVVATVWFLARPLLSSGEVGSNERAQLALLRDRLLAQLNELDAARADQSMEDSAAQDEQRRLEFELAQVLKRLDAVPAPGDTDPAVKPRRSRALAAAAALALILPVFAAGLYAWQGRATLAQLAALPSDGTPGEAGEVPPMVAEMVARLEERLKANPKDAEGWMRLGRSYAVLNRLGDAESAYAKAYALAPRDPAILSDYAWFLYSQNPTQTSDRVVMLYSQLHTLQPQHADALWVLGLAAYQQGDGARALALWEELLRNVPPESPAAASVAKAVEQLKKNLKTPG